MRHGISYFSIFMLIILLLPYMGVGYPAYPIFIVVLILFINKLRLTIGESMLYITLIVIVISKLGVGSISHSLLSLKYFYGFIVFYILFRQDFHFLKINFNFLLSVISIIMIIEAILINTILPINFWFNYNKSLVDYAVANPETYMRPYGIGTNASVTTTILICLMLIRDKVQIVKRRVSRVATLLGIIAIIFSASGTGYVLLLLYYLFKKLNYLRVVLISMLTFLLYISLIYMDAFTGQSGISIGKISPDYISRLVKVKSLDYLERYSSKQFTLHEQLLGKNWLEHQPLPLGGDFGIINMLVYGGIITVAFYILFVLFKINKYNFAPIVILIVSAFHYSAIFSLAGQIIFAFCLALGEKNVKNWATS
jgi:hypothetical protein